MDPRERYSSPEEAARASLRSNTGGLWTNLPGIIVSVDLTKMTAVVQPAVQGAVRSQDGKLTYKSLPTIPDVPIQFPSGGGYTMTFPVKAGDECQIHFQCRNIDAWWQQGGVQKPLDLRMHDLSDAFCSVGVRSQKRLVENISTENAQLRSDDGKLVVDLDTPNGRLRLVNEGLVLDIDKPAGKITLTAPTEIVLTAPKVTIEGDLDVTGEVVGKRDDADIHLTTHKHGGVQGGPSETDEPVTGS